MKKITTTEKFDDKNRLIEKVVTTEEYVDWNTTSQWSWTTPTIAWGPVNSTTTSSS